MLPDTKIYHWTWVKPEIFAPDKLWNQEMINNKETINFIGWEKTSNELKELLNSEADYVFDLTKKIDRHYNPPKEDDENCKNGNCTISGGKRRNKSKRRSKKGKSKSRRNKK